MIRRLLVWMLFAVLVATLGGIAVEGYRRGITIVGYERQKVYVYPNDSEGAQELERLLDGGWSVTSIDYGGCCNDIQVELEKPVMFWDNLDGYWKR